MNNAREFLNLLITKQLTRKKFMQLKNDLELNEDMLTIFLRIQKRRELDKEILKTFSIKIAEFACNSKSNAEFIMDFIESQDGINRFHRQIMKRIKKGDHDPRLKEFLEFYAI